MFFAFSVVFFHVIRLQIECKYIHAHSITNASVHAARIYLNDVWLHVEWCMTIVDVACLLLVVAHRHWPQKAALLFHHTTDPIDYVYVGARTAHACMIWWYICCSITIWIGMQIGWQRRTHNCCVCTCRCETHRQWLVKYHAPSSDIPLCIVEDAIVVCNVLK